MGAQTFIASRREMLGVAASTVIAVPSIALARNDRRFHHAVELERTRRVAFELYHAEYVAPVAARHTALRYSFGPAHVPVTQDQRKQLDGIDIDGPQSRFDDLVSAHYDAFEALMLTPAPTVSGLAVKLAVFAKDEGWDCTAVGKMIAAITADAARLSQGDA